MNLRIKLLVLAGLACAALAGAVVAVQHLRTEQDIDHFEARVAAIAQRHPAPAWSPARLQALPPPVQRYFRFTFAGGAHADAPAAVPAAWPAAGVADRPAAASPALVRLAASGRFRRPGAEDFQPTTARQVIAIGVPALMFSATTPVLPGVWARAYDFFAEGQMEMKAKVLSTITVVDERQTPALNEVSLRRWLLESALYPAALLPGGPVTWQALDDGRARAVVEWAGLRASMVAHFAPDGRMTHMQAEHDGDLTTPYHGSGEHVSRSDYQRIGHQMIPMAFTISRMAGGRLHPFWDGRVDVIAFE